MIAIDGLSLTLRKRVILDDISARLQTGEVTAILGPNGAGKSSLLHCIAALHIPTAGHILLDGINVQAMPPRDRARRIGYLPQDVQSHWNLEMRAVVELGRMPYHRGWQATVEDKRAVDSAITATGISDLEGRKILRLSGGEKARVHLARILAGEPGWILADEPLASLDPAHQMQMAALLKQAAQGGKGVVIILHDLTQAARMADKLLLLKEGRLHGFGTPADMLTRESIGSLYGVETEIVETASGPQVAFTHRP